MLERWEGTPVGRAVLSVFVAFTVVAVLVVNMPDSQLRRDISRVTQPYVNAVGLDQNWGIFSQPRTLSAYVYARVDDADGSATDVAFPAGKVLGAYVDYRWQKFEEQIRPDDGAALWPAYARYVAARARDEGGDPVRVSLVRRFADTNPPGPGPARVPWQEFTFYVLTVGPA